MENLSYRRQFLLAKGKVTNSLLDEWINTELNSDYNLYTHKDLEINRVIFGENELIILGYIIDPYNPKKSNIDILNDISKYMDNFEKLLSFSSKYSGRWIIINKFKDDINVFNDTCSLRQIYYIKNKNYLWLASQPNLLAYILRLKKSEDKDLLYYMNSDFYKNQESPWYGDETEYENIYHLLPNHYINIYQHQVNRFQNVINKKDNSNVQDIINQSSYLIKGSIDSIVNRGKTMLAVTGGIDSRLLLAASKDNRSDILYYVSTKNILDKNHADIKIPRKLDNALGLNLMVIDNLTKVREEFWEYLQKNVSRARLVPKTLTIQYLYDNYSDYININGNASGIAKNVYGTNFPDNKEISADDLMKLINCPPDINYVRSSIQNWLEDAKKQCEKDNLLVTDLFYWEQTMGNWGAMYQAELDIAIEEFTPFSNRDLMSLLLSTDSNIRESPKYTLYINIIEKLWKDVLSEKINPISFNTFIINILKKILPIEILNKLKNYRNSRYKNKI